MEELKRNIPSFLCRDNLLDINIYKKVNEDYSMRIGMRDEIITPIEKKDS